MAIRRWSGLLVALGLLTACDLLDPDVQPTLDLTLDTGDPIAAEVIGVTAVLEDDEGLDELVIAWGDGATDTYTLEGSSETVQAEHAYGAVGDFTVTGTVRDVGGQEFTAMIPLTVGAASVAVSPANSVLNAIGYQTSLSAAVFDAAGAALEDAPVEWLSLAPDVATVAAAGLVTAVVSGEARIEARAGGRADTVVVTVRQIPATLEFTLPDTVSAREPLGSLVEAWDSNGVAIADPLSHIDLTASEPNLFSTSELWGLKEGTVELTATGGDASASHEMVIRLTLLYTTGGSNNQGLYLVDRQGTRVRRVIDEEISWETEGHWSPDRTRIVFSEQQGLHVMNADGTGATLILDDPGARQPVWAPDGSAIAFTSDRDGDQEIYTIHPDGTGLTRLTDSPGVDEAPSWSPDGSRIAFHSQRSGNTDVFVMGADGSETVNLTADHVGQDSQPGWSPDGTKIVFVSARESIAIHVMNADGSGVGQVSPNYGLAPTWSPDGDWIAYVGISAFGNMDLFVMDTSGGSIVQVTNDENGDMRPRWR